MQPPWEPASTQRTRDRILFIPRKPRDISSGHIHWARGTASVDRHGTEPPSEIGTSILLNKKILENIFVTQHADQRWINILNMVRRVNSTWNHVARSIYPEFTTNPFREQTKKEKRRGDPPSFAIRKRPTKGSGAGGNKQILSSRM